MSGPYAILLALSAVQPLIRDRLINGDASVTGVNVTLQLPGLDPTEVTAAVETARRLSDQFSRENAGIEVYLTGFAMLNNAFQEISMSELTRLMPIMFGSGTGTRVMKRIAAPMVGGLVSSTLLTLIVIPALYLLWKKRSISAAAVDDGEPGIRGD